ncbi:exopolysaccharide biosynthesis polyprenyl glycosylphosphotransferase [Streptomyces spectabilis]|uniref:exopolysaccharide biosynthesis polyprenyl glycosylphosphotransferase n=1 Tax=Streptomyces spectabilis TaxID=68270 RepID=UPI0034031AF8
MSAERTVTTSSGELRQHQQDPAAAVVVAPREALATRAEHGTWQPARQRPVLWPLLAADGAAAALGVCAYAPYTSGYDAAWTSVTSWAAAVALLAAVVLALHAHGGLYRPPRMPRVLDELPALSGRVAVAWCVTATCATSLSGLPVLPPLAPLASPSPIPLLAACAAHCALGALGRALLYWRFRRALTRGPRPVLVLGHGPRARAVALALLRQPRCGMRPVGVVCDPAEPADRGQDPAPGLPVLSTVDELQRAAIQNDIRTVLIATGRTDSREHWLPALRALGCDLWELAPASAPARHQHVAGFPCRPLPPGGPLRTSLRKRALDVLVSAALLVAAAPVLLVCAALLRALEGPGIVFRQERVGKDGRPFTLLKFRTHRPADPQEAATRWSVADEHRMSAYCRFLRRTSLDELPQLWNVLRGDMSLVGPRPERPYFVAQFSQKYPDYAHRHRMPTGITGLAQIHGLRGDTSIEDRCRFDNTYIDSWSFWQDLCILLRTVSCLVRHSGS